MTSNVIRAIWLNNPYAHLMAYGKIETRPYPTKVRGKVLICSCKKEFTYMQISEISGSYQMARINKALKDLGQPWNGYAICIADLVDCRPMTSDDEDKCFVQYREGLWCWIFENVQEVEYFQLKGKQGWAILDEETKQKIKIIK